MGPMVSLIKRLHCTCIKTGSVGPMVSLIKRLYCTCITSLINHLGFSLACFEVVRLVSLTCLVAHCVNSSLYNSLIMLKVVFILIMYSMNRRANDVADQ